MTDLDRMMNGFNDEIVKIARFGPLPGMLGSAARGVAQAATSGAQSAGGVLGRFAGRQAHSLTGWTPAGGVQSLRAGAWDTGQQLDTARAGFAAAKGQAAQGAKVQRGLMDTVMRRSDADVATRGLKKGIDDLHFAERAHRASVNAENMGLTSLPGYAKAMKTHGVGKTLSTGLKEQWHGVGPVGKGLMVGLPALSVGSELAREGGPEEAGRLSRAGARIGDIAYTMGPLPFAGQVVAQTALGGMGKRVGALFDKKKPQSATTVPAPPSLEPAGGEAEAGERIVTERSMGMGGSL